jgi:hypothetical protein
MCSSSKSHGQNNTNALASKKECRHARLSKQVILHCTMRSRILVCLSQVQPDLGGMNIDQTIAEIERLERIFAVPDTRPLSPSDLSAANRRHDEMLAHSPWFRLWQRYGVCCRPENPALRLGEIES